MFQKLDQFPISGKVLPNSQALHTTGTVTGDDMDLRTNLVHGQ